MELWVARDKNGDLWLYDCEPTRMNNYWHFNGYKSDCYEISKDLFPDITWESEPIQVELNRKE
jgi:hypothetical protein